MYMANVASTIVYSIPAGSPIATSWDVSVEDSLGNYTYYESVSAVVQPTAEADGTVTFTFLPTVAGVHTLVLSQGSASSHSIKNKKLLSVVEHTALTTINVTL